MNYIEKTLHCSKLNIPIKAKYFIGELDLSGTKKKKIVKFFECEARNVCRRDYDLNTCDCFLEMKNIEKDIALKV